MARVNFKSSQLWSILVICIIGASSAMIIQHTQDQRTKYVTDNSDISTLFNHKKNLLAIRDSTTKMCYLKQLPKTLDSDMKILVRDFDAHNEYRKLSAFQAWNFAGREIFEFCQPFKYYRIINFNRANHRHNLNEIQSRRKKRNTKYRGQTQSQFLSFGKDTDGKAEAESSKDGTRAVVTGSGIGQAQSQSEAKGSCDDCLGFPDSQAQRLAYNGDRRQPGAQGTRFPPDTQFLGRDRQDLSGTSGKDGQYPSRTTGRDQYPTTGIIDQNRPFTPTGIQEVIPGRDDKLLPGGIGRDSQYSPGGSGQDGRYPLGIGRQDSRYPSGVGGRDGQYPSGVEGQDGRYPLGGGGRDSKYPPGIGGQDSQPPTGIGGQDSRSSTGVGGSDSRYPTGVGGRDSQYKPGIGGRDGQYSPEIGGRDGQYPPGIGGRDGQYSPGIGGRDGQYPPGVGGRDGQYPSGVSGQEGQYTKPSDRDDRVPTGGGLGGQYPLVGSQDSQYPLRPTGGDRRIPPGGGTSSGQYPVGPGDQGGPYTRRPIDQDGRILPGGTGQDGQFPQGIRGQDGRYSTGIGGYDGQNPTRTTAGDGDGRIPSSEIGRADQYIPGIGGQTSQHSVNSLDRDERLPPRGADRDGQYPTRPLHGDERIHSVGQYPGGRYQDGQFPSGVTGRDGTVPAGVIGRDGTILPYNVPSGTTQHIDQTGARRDSQHHTTSGQDFYPQGSQYPHKTPSGTTGRDGHYVPGSDYSQTGTSGRPGTGRESTFTVSGVFSGEGKIYSGHPGGIETSVTDKIVSLRPGGGKESGGAYDSQHIPGKISPGSTFDRHDQTGTDISRRTGGTYDRQYEGGKSPSGIPSGTLYPDQGSGYPTQYDKTGGIKPGGDFSGVRQPSTGYDHGQDRYPSTDQGQYDDRGQIRPGDRNAYPGESIYDSQGKDRRPDSGSLTRPSSLDQGLQTKPSGTYDTGSNGRQQAFDRRPSTGGTGSYDGRAPGQGQIYDRYDDRKIDGGRDGQYIPGSGGRDEQYPGGVSGRDGQHTGGPIVRDGQYPSGTPGRDGQYPSGTPGRDGQYPSGTPGRDGQYPSGTQGRDGQYPGGTIGRDGQYPSGTISRDGQYPSGTFGRDGQYPTGTPGRDGQYPSGTPGRDGQYPGGTIGRDGQYSPGTRGRDGQYPSGTPGQVGQYPSGTIRGDGQYSGRDGQYPTGTPGRDGQYPGGTTGQDGQYISGVPGRDGQYPSGIPGRDGQYPSGTIGRDGQYKPDSGVPSTGREIYGARVDSIGPISRDRQSGIYDETNLDQIGTRTTVQWPSGGETSVDQSQIGAPKGHEDEADSLAESSVQQTTNGTQSSASASGIFAGGTAQAQVSGTYTGSGSFSAQAGTSDSNKAAHTQVSGGKHGGSSSAQGRGGKGQSQTQVQLNSETGATSSNAQSSGINHGTNTQVQAGGKGGMADAQASGLGSTSSQAQIGFQPYQESLKKEHDKLATIFQGGGSSSAQSGTHNGQSQAQLTGNFKYGISYTGAAQAGSGTKESVEKARKQLRPTTLIGFENTTIDDFTGFSAPNPEKSESPVQSDDKDEEILKESESKFNSQSTKSGLDVVVPVVDEEDEPNQTPPYEDGEDDYDYEEDYEASPSISGPTHLATKKGNEIKQSGSRQSQSISLGPLENLDAHIVQDSSLLKEGAVINPGQSIPGTDGYKIPAGFRGRVTSISNKDDAIAIGEESQAQSIKLVPGGTGKIIYNKPVVNLRNLSPLKPATTPYSTSYVNRPDSFVTVTKSVSGDYDPTSKVRGIEPKKYTHTYYTKSSTCGYFTFSCNIVYGTNGRTKICRPKAPTNPDGTRINC